MQTNDDRFMDVTFVLKSEARAEKKRLDSLRVKKGVATKSGVKLVEALDNIIRLTHDQTTVNNLLILRQHIVETVIPYVNSVNN